MITHLDSSNISLTREAAFEFFEESQLPGMLKFDYWMKRWGDIFASKMGTIIADLDENKVVRGMLGALVFPCWMTGDIEVLEAFWYVRKPFRGAGVAIPILTEFEDWGRSQGAKRAKMVHLEVINADKLEKLYLKLGYEKLQRCYTKEL